MTADKIKNLIEKYGNDEKAIIRENASLSVLYEFSNQRVGIIDFLDIPKDASILFVGEPETAFKNAFANYKYDVMTLFAEKDNMYDYVIAIGTIHKLTAEQLSDIKAHIKKGGKLIVACDNKYGLKYVNGAKISDCNFAKNKLKDMLGDNLTWYYPMPDYLLPVSIYSDDYLPKRGELSRNVSAYNDPEITIRNIGNMYDEICDDGKFSELANSFLVVKTF